MTRGGSQVYVLFSALYAPHMGGVESYTAHLAAELARRGHRVAVVTSRLAPEHPEREVQADGVEVFRLPCTPLLKGRLPLPRRNADHARLLGEVAALGPTRVVVNARFYGHSLDGARFAAKLGVAAIVVEHGSAHLSLGNAALDRLVEAYEHRATKRLASFRMPFFGVSRACLDWLGHFGIRGAGVVPNSVDAEAYALSASKRDFRRELGISQDELLVASVGRLVPEKGVGALLDAARILGNEGFAFAFAGDGPLHAAVEAASSPARHGKRDERGGKRSRDEERSCKVFALGRLSPSDTAALLRDADVYCLPSRSEGFATTLLEACAMGAFPVTTEVGGVKELGIGEVGGIVLEEATGSCVAEALRRAKEQRRQCEAEGRALRETTAENNSWSASADALEQAFSSLEDPRRRGESR